jgi:hypothetical protein
MSDMLKWQGTIRDCEATDHGWRGRMPDGTMLEVKPRDPDTRAEIPEEVYCFQNGEFTGAYLIERRRRQQARRKSVNRSAPQYR